MEGAVNLNSHISKTQGFGMYAYPVTEPCHGVNCTQRISSCSIRAKI